MKTLLYKEFKLSIHPLTYFFVALMALSALAPTFPSFVPLLYFGVSYTFLFIGKNKTTTTNDLFYTCNLPIRREDVVKARVCSTTVLQLFELVLVFSFFFVSAFFRKNMKPEEAKIAWITIDQGLFLLGVYLLCFSVFDIIYLPWFYRNGKSIILNMFVAVIATTLVGGLLTIIPYFTFKDFISVKGGNIVLQVGFLLASLGIWIGSKVLVTKWSAKNLTKLDF